MRKNYLFVFIFLLSNACTLDHIAPIRGNIEGNVTLRRNDYYLVQDMSGVKVRLEGIDPLVEAQTDKGGHWVMGDVPAGTYNITYSKDGYNSFKQFGVQHVGGRVSTWPYVDNLVALSIMTKMKVVKVVPSVSKSTVKFAINVTAPPKGENSGTVFFFKRSGQASSNDYDFSEYVEYPDNTTFEKNYLVAQLKMYYGYKTGDDISVRFYGISGRSTVPDDVYRYYDPNLDLYIYPNISDESIDVSFKMP